MLLLSLGLKLSHLGTCHLQRRRVTSEPVRDAAGVGRRVGAVEHHGGDLRLPPHQRHGGEDPHVGERALHTPVCHRGAVGRPHPPYDIHPVEEALMRMKEMVDMHTPTTMKRQWNGAKLFLCMLNVVDFHSVTDYYYRDKKCTDCFSGSFYVAAHPAGMIRKQCCVILKILSWFRNAAWLAFDQQVSQAATYCLFLFCLT